MGGEDGGFGQSIAEKVGSGFGLRAKRNLLPSLIPPRRGGWRRAALRRVGSTWLIALYQFLQGGPPPDCSLSPATTLPGGEGLAADPSSYPSPKAGWRSARPAAVAAICRTALHERS